MLLNFLDTKLFDRQGKAVTNIEYTLPPARSDLAQELTKDPYNFDFITLTRNYNEKELKDALMDNITAFLLELGNGFAFVGREYRIEIGDTENFIDMLFYHIKLHCYVVVEVKARSVIIVEGPGEALLLPTIAKLLGRNFTDFGTSLVDVRSTGLRRYAGIFQRVDGDTLLDIY